MECSLKENLRILKQISKEVEDCNDTIDQLDLTVYAEYSTQKQQKKHSRIGIVLSPEYSS